MTKKNQTFTNFVVIFLKNTFFKKQKRHSIEDSKTNKKHITLFVPESTPEALQCTPFISAKKQSYLRNDSIFSHKINTVAVSTKE